ncbi:MAG TPA: spermidine/putrescine ABC transporter substrate-binding protein [Gallionellaceae bacterium]|nr:spermidine/putrescine ABC transporter substrate-binding protein [Gallionellaceae bacterium]
MFSACKPHLSTTVLLLLCIVTPAWGATPVLRVLAWPGYAETEVVQSFERQHGVRVEVTVITSDTSLWQKISARNKDYDVFAVNAAELQRYIASDLVLPLSTELIPNTGHQLARFRELAAIPGLVSGGKAYGIPFTYSEMGLIYDRKQIAAAPTTIAALWDPRYRGKVIAYDGGTHNFSLSAQSLRLKSPFRIEAADWPRVAKQLIAMRRNVLGYYSQPEESVQLFLRHKAALMFANYGMQQVHLLKAAGADIAYVIPKEGALAWLDCWVITRSTRDSALSHAWIDHMLGEQASRLLTERQGLASTLVEQADRRPGDRLLWLQPPEDTGRREKLWGRIRSGDPLVRVMAP